MTSTVDYAYAAPSVLTDGPAGLRLATSGGSGADGAVDHPFFFAGFVRRPEVVAAGLLAVAAVARTRFYTPPNMVAAIIRAADPVVTVGDAGLRFESFSACCGVYARLDVDADALDAEQLSPGVTNVDVNPPLRQALATVRAGDPLRLRVGDDALHVATLDAEVIEDRVALPDRWLKGFAESQSLSSEMTVRHRLDAAATTRFVRALPRTSATRTVLWSAGSTRGLRLGTAPRPGSVCVAGPERLRVLEPLIRQSSALSAYGPPVDRTGAPTASAWVLELPGGRLTVALSPEKSRGFSGEGAVLDLLADDTAADDADLLSALLAFNTRIDVGRLAAYAGRHRDRVAAGLAVLATSGQVGYDVHAQSYFHRPLPFRTDALGALHPRLVAARTLVQNGAVSVVGDGVAVRSGDTTYLVRPSADGRTCTCPWFAAHRSHRGPCKHLLAASLFAETGTATR